MKINFKKPLKGVIKNITETPDEVFSSKMLGPGFVIIPEDGTVTAPIDAEIVTIFPTGHAIGLKTKKGLEILIHVGLDTVELKGEGFTLHKKVGDKVKTGDILITFDLDFITKNATSSATPVVFLQKNDVKIVKEHNDSLTYTLKIE